MGRAEASIARNGWYLWSKLSADPYDGSAACARRRVAVTVWLRSAPIRTLADEPPLRTWKAGLHDGAWA